MADYGYTTREDPPARAIPSQTPTSRVTSPVRMESREVERVAKAPAADTEPAIYTHLIIGNGVNAIGNAPSSGFGGAGSSTSTYGWLTGARRYGIRIEVTGGSSGGEGYHVFYFVQVPTPRAYLDPAWRGTRGMGVTRYADTVRFVKTSGLAGHVSCRIGLASDSRGAISILYNFIGFDIIIDNTASTGTWNARASDAAGNSLYLSNTGIATETIHRLEVELDAVNGRVRWFIDGVQVAEWTPGSNEAVADTAAATTKRWMYSCQAQDYLGIGIGAMEFFLDGWMVGQIECRTPEF